MSAAALLLLLAAPAAAQDASTMTSTSTSTVSASTAAVSASSTTAPSIDDVAGHGFKVGGAAPKAKLSRPIHAVIHKEAAEWEPIALRTGGVPGSTDNSVALKVVKLKGRMKGENSKAKSYARLHKGKKDSTWLVISVYPKTLETRRIHFEIRFRIFEGFVEELEVAAVTVTERRHPPKFLYDSYELREQGVEYQEERPGSGEVVVAALDQRPGKGAVNSGRVEKAEFPGSEFGFVNLSWAANGAH